LLPELSGRLTSEEAPSHTPSFARTATSRLRAKSIAISSTIQAAFFTMWQFVLPFIFSPNEANLGAKTSFIFGGLSVLCWIYLYFYQPETARRSFEEIDELLLKHVPARKSKGFKTDAEQMGEDALCGKTEVRTRNESKLADSSLFAPLLRNDFKTHAFSSSSRLARNIYHKLKPVRRSIINHILILGSMVHSVSDLVSASEIQQPSGHLQMLWDLEGYTRRTC
jgi:hypothetical protein